MRERWQLALRPWDYSDIAWLWGALLALMALTIVLQSRGRARAAHHVMAGAGAVVTGVFAFQLVTHYARCSACSLPFDLSPNAASWAFLYDFFVTSIVLAVFVWQELRRFGEPRALAWGAGTFVVPLVVAPLVFARLHAWEEDEARPRDVRSLRWVYVALVVVALPLVMPALPLDHFGDLGGEFFWDGTSNQANTYVAYAILLVFGQIFLYTLPRTPGFWLRVASLFFAFQNIGAYLALYLAWFDGRFLPPRRFRFARGGAGAQIAVILVGNVVAALFGVVLRFTHFIIKAPETVCHEGEVTRARELPRCLAELEAALPSRVAAASTPGANGWARALPDETRACITLAHDALGAQEGRARELVKELARHHGSDLRSCQEAASANYAVLCECAEIPGSSAGAPR